jgi:hypothetical protein
LGGGWQISTGDFAELLGPALFAFAALASAWVLFDARRRAGRLQTALWTLATLSLPFVFLPLYLAARLLTRSDAANTAGPAGTEGATAGADATGGTDSAESAGITPDLAPGPDDDDNAVRRRSRAGDGTGGGLSAGPAEDGEEAGGVHRTPRARWREFALPLGYAAALLALGFIYFALERRSFDAHFARAKRAKLRGETAHTIDEYRAALRRRDDAHTRKLLGLELLREGRGDEALEEFRAARGGADEADDTLPFHEGRALDALARRAEAVEAYADFAGGPLCSRSPDDDRCEAARERLGRP